MKKKVLALFMVLAMALSLVPVTALAEENTTPAEQTQGEQQNEQPKADPQMEQQNENQSPVENEGEVQEPSQGDSKEETNTPSNDNT